MNCPQCGNGSVMAIAGSTKDGKTDFYCRCEQCGYQWHEKR